MRVLRILAMSAASVALICLGSLLPWRVLAENLAAFDGTIYATLRAVSLANFPASVGGAGTFSPGALVTEYGPRSMSSNSPGAGGTASATLAANATGRRVLDCVMFSAVSTGAVTAANVAIAARDGATGAGTILLTWQVAFTVAAGAGQQVVPQYSQCGIGLVGTTNTAMTVEMSAGVANAQPTVQFVSHLVQ